MALVQDYAPLVRERPEAPSGRIGRAQLVGSLLEEQSDLTAVERFAQFHDDATELLQSRYYSALIPATPPGPGQQLAFEVDLDRCSGCKACVAACHTLNGLDEGETWREVGLLVGGTTTLPVLQHVTSSCHHCLEPACLTACPVNAYEKEPLTGIVKHLDDQCIGCQYCTLACPYDVPKFHSGKGIVRKCDMCSDRLRAGEAPACVQACPHEAIRIRVVDREAVAARSEAGVFLPAAPDPRFTRPTTVYRASRPDELRSANGGYAEPEHGHTPLAVMLVLTQLSVGGFLIELVARLLGCADGIAAPVHTPLCLAFAFLGLGASLLHLGRPLFAYRAILGFRHSWLSREVVALGVFAKLAAAYVAAEVLAPGWLAVEPGLRLAGLALVVAAGAVGVGCSVMVYDAVRRPFWRAASSGVKFAGTAVVLGLAVALASLDIAALGPAAHSAAAGLPAVAVAAALAVALLAKLGFEAADCRAVDEPGPLGSTARLLRGPLQRFVRARRFFGIAGGVVLPLMAIAAAAAGFPVVAAATALLALVAALAGELLERSLFFTAAARSRMPGGLPS
jgi:Fe-S-cluster-containing dehydrogenase component/DMSO reductase anchor subunit